MNILKTSDHNKHLLGVRIIGGCKLLYGLLLAAAGLGIFHLMNRNLGQPLEHYILNLHLDPKNHISKALLRLTGLDRRQLEDIDAGTFFFAADEVIEGIGLLLAQHWAEYLTIFATSALLLPEGYEIAMKMSLLRMAVFMLNLVIVLYLVHQLRRNHCQTK
jgi:uncharacterized membrane protein (DUF2068 family)